MESETPYPLHTMEQAERESVPKTDMSSGYPTYNHESSNLRLLVPTNTDKADTKQLVTPIPRILKFLEFEGVSGEFILLSLINPRVASKQGVIASKLVSGMLQSVKMRKVDKRAVKVIAMNAQKLFYERNKAFLIDDGVLNSPGPEHGVSLFTVHLTYNISGATDDDLKTLAVSVAQCAVSVHGIEDTKRLVVWFSRSSESKWGYLPCTDIKVTLNVFGTLYQHHCFTKKLCERMTKLWPTRRALLSYREECVQGESASGTVKADTMSKFKDCSRILQETVAIMSMSNEHDYLFEDVLLLPATAALYGSTRMVTVTFETPKTPVTVIEHKKATSLSKRFVELTRYVDGDMS